MKTINMFIASALTVLLIACSSGTGVEPEKEFEPYRVGSFEFTSPNEATYIGVEDKSKARTLSSTDTLVVTDPSSFTFEVWEDSTMYQGPAVSFRYTDSTKHIAYKDVLMHFQWGNEDIRAPLASRSVSSGGGIYAVEGYFGSPCKYRVEDDIVVDYYTESTNTGNTPFRTIILRTEDIDLVGMDILRCSDDV